VTTSKGQYWECPCKLAGLTKTPFTMGYNPNTNGTYQSGLDAKANIYETRLYNRVLSKEEIAHNMNFAKTKYNF
jgi:hypothetical protein